MHVTEQKLRQLIREIFSEPKDLPLSNNERLPTYVTNQQSMAQEDAPLGKYAFSPQRQMQSRPPPFERNTPVEASLLRSIRKHFAGDRPLSRQQAQMVFGFIDSGLYRDVFIEAPAGTYYRGMGLSETDLRRLGIDTTVLSPPAPVTQQGRFEIKPLGDRFSSSWTSDFSIAGAFAASPHGVTTEGTIYSVIFSADTVDNPRRFIDAAGFYGIDLGNFNDFTSEKEVIGLGTIIANSVHIEELL